MEVIFIIILVLFLVLISWMWNSLGHIEKKTKSISIIIGLLIVYVLTFIIFNISKIGVDYNDKYVMQVIRNIFVILFTVVNGYIILPYIFTKLEHINNNEIKKEKLIKSMIIFIIIVLIIFAFEVIYLRNMQYGIFDIMNKMMNK